jgi:hypothetical protein
MADNTLREMLYKTFSKLPEKEREQVKADAIVPTVKPSEPIKVESPKSVGDVTIALQAQGIYDGSMSAAPPSAPNAKQADRGTTGAMEVKSKWDRGNE